jgi:hypothetical protein
LTAAKTSLKQIEKQRSLKKQRGRKRENVTGKEKD